jgi:hypothetical protein
MEDYFLIYNRLQYEAGIKAGIFDFTKEDLDRAKNSDKGFVGERNKVSFYLSVNIPSEK